MKELFRDTVTGHFLRIVSRGKVLPYEEDQDPSIWKKYVSKEKSGHMAHHGTIEPEEKDEERAGDEGSTDNSDKAEETEEELSTRQRQPETSTSRESSGTRVGGEAGRINSVSGVKVDPEKGRDASIVSWYSKNDPEVCT
jgi:DHA1 family multidrug resistance protein-like MFS transporter